MPKSVAERVVRRRGPKPKPKTAAEAELQELDRKHAPARRRISHKDRAFLTYFREQEFKDPDGAAKRAGFTQPFVGGKLVLRLGDLIDAEKVAAMVGTEMQAEEALRILASCVRDTDHPKHDAYVRLQLQVLGMLSDKGPSAKDKKQLTRDVMAAVERIQSELRKRPGARTRVRAAVASGGDGTGARARVHAAIEVETADATPAPGSPDHDADHGLPLLEPGDPTPDRPSER